MALWQCEAVTATRTTRKPRPPVMLDALVDDPEHIRELVRANAPYWPVQRYINNSAEYAALSGDPRLDVPWRPDLTVIVFRLREADDADQLALLARINRTQRVLLSSTRVEGRVYLRLAILSVRTHADRVAEALDIISAAIDAA